VENKWIGYVPIVGDARIVGMNIAKII